MKEGRYKDRKDDIKGGRARRKVKEGRRRKEGEGRMVKDGRKEGCQEGRKVKEGRIVKDERKEGEGRKGYRKGERKEELYNMFSR